MGLNLKICNVCLLEKTLEEFCINKKSPDGHAWTCKTCNYARVKIWRETNKDKRIEQDRRHRNKHPEVGRRACRKYYATNREQEVEKARIYRFENPEKVRDAIKRSVDKNRKETNERRRFAYRENREIREKNTITHREYIRRHPEKNRTYTQNWLRKRRAGGRFTDKEWKWLVDLCGNKCLCPCELCDGTISRDHIDPDGLNVIENLQPLCRPCNSSKSNRSIIDFRPQWLIENFAKLKAEAGL